MAAHVGSFLLDDLLVSCSQEIIKNGIETNSVPDTVKDWLFGKIMRSLPSPLVKRLLSYLLDQRDIAETFGFKESVSGDEFTLILHRSVKQKSQTEYFESINPSRPLSSHKVFNNEKKISNDGIGFYADEMLLDHREIVPKNIFQRRSSPVEKIEKTPPPREVPCADCDITFKNNLALRKHIKIAHPERWELLRPETETQAAVRRISDIQQDSLTGQYHCKLCRKIFKNAPNAVNHYNEVHKQIKKAVCKTCGKSFSKMTNYRRHLLTHTGDKPIKCPYCQVPFSRTDKMKEHAKRYHPNEYDENYMQMNFNKAKRKKTDSETPKN